MHLAPEAKPNKLYKYVSADGARQILRDGKVRCSSPVLFNDPFDGQIEAALDFSNQALDDYMAQRVMEFAAAGSPIPVGASDVFKYQYERFKELLAAGKSSDEAIEADALIRRLAETLAEPNEVQRPREPIKWSKTQRDFRVSSFSETHESIIMWSHYADHHRGACLEFSAHPDGLMQYARQVQYLGDLPNFASLKEWGDFLLGLGDLNRLRLVEDYLLRKNPEWNYEREWRILFPKSSSDDLYYYLPFNEAELSALYLGLRMRDVDRFALQSLCAGKYSSIAIKQAARSKKQFCLEFFELVE
jgi:hypothetical protein